MADVAAVTRVMWDTVFPPWTRCRLAEELGLEEPVAGEWVVYLAGLHDLGKASPAFQRKVEAACAPLGAAGLRFPKSASSALHGTVSAAVLRELLQEHGLGADIAGRLATVVGGHHGVFPTSADIGNLHPDAVGRGRWAPLRKHLTGLLADLVELPLDARPATLRNAAAMKIDGLVSVADWIGSNEKYFPHLAPGAVVPTPDLQEYWTKAQSNAQKALQRLGWAGWTPTASALSFSELFAGREPRPMRCPHARGGGPVLGCWCKPKGWLFLSVEVAVGLHGRSVERPYGMCD